MAQKSLLREGQTIIHDGRELKIIKSLSSGLTGEVYQASLALPGQSGSTDVVVKAMKSLDFPLARQLFYKEGETLASLMHLEEEIRDSLAENLKIAPVYYGLSEHRPDPDTKSFPYLVMELIKGTQVQEILGKQKTLPEAQALVIGWHLYRILDILHTRLLKTFIDLKFENLWWVENDSKWGGQLKLTDFGTLDEIKRSDTKKRGVARDILLGGIYLLTILTGYKLNNSLGELKEPARPVINRFKNEMTWGARKLLLKLLHRNRTVRFGNVADVLTELRQLVNFWSQPTDRLAEMAQKNLSSAEKAAEQANASNHPISDAGLAAASRAYSALDILRLKDPQRFDPGDIQRAKNVLSKGDYSERARALLKGRSFTLARQTFEEGMRSSEDAALFRRWSYVARIGEEIPPASFESRFENEVDPFLEGIKALDLDAPEKWQAASEFCDVLASEYKDDEQKSIRPSLSSKGLSYLKKECHLFAVIGEASNSFASKSFSAAGQLYKQAREILYGDSEGVTFPAEIVAQIEEEVGIVSLDEFFSNFERASETSLQRFAQAAESLRQGEIVTGVGDNDGREFLPGVYTEKRLKAVDQAREAYILGRDVPLRFEKLLELCQLALEIGSIRPAEIELYVHASRQIAEIGMQEFGEHKDYDKICIVTTRLDLALQDAALVDPVACCTHLSEAHEMLAEKGSLVEAVAIESASLASKQPQFLLALADCVERLVPTSSQPATWRASASRLIEKQAAEYHHQIDELMREVHYILLPVLPDTVQSKNLGEILQETANQANILRGFELVSLRDRASRLEKANVLLEKAVRLLGEDEYRREEIMALHQAVCNSIEPTQAAALTQTRTRAADRHARIMALSEDRLKLEEQLKWIQYGARWSLDSDTQISLQLPLRQKLVDFLYRCYQVKADDPEGLQEAVERQKTLHETGEDVANLDAVDLEVFVNWSTHALNMLGASDWKRLAHSASEHQESYVVQLKQAAEDFASGNLGPVGAALDHTQTELGLTAGWQELKSKFAQASAWNLWCASRAGQFQSETMDENLLRDLRAFVRLGLPALYWQQSPTGGYLEMTTARLEEAIRAALKSKVYDQTFVEAIRALLNVTWTKRLAAGDKERHVWNKSAWLRRAFDFALVQDATRLIDHIKQTPSPDEVEQALNSIDYPAWDLLQLEYDEKIRQEEDRRAALAVQEKERREDDTRKWFRAGRMALIGGLSLFIVLGLAVAGFLAYRANTERISSLLYGTATLTLTPTLTPTLTLTLTPSLTPTPTETLTPTPIPASKFLLPAEAVNSLYPLSPVIGDAYWLINDSDQGAFNLTPALGAPEQVWQEAASKDQAAKGEKFIYTVTGNGSVTWMMDVPLDVTGYYQIFVTDTKEFSSQLQTFNVLLDHQMVKPYRGANQVILQNVGQAAEKWTSLGVYQANAGQTLAVQIALGALTEKTPFAVDRLLIVRLNESTCQMLDQLPEGRTLVSLLDDPTAKFFAVIGGKATQTKERGSLFTDVQAWNGSLTSRLLDKAVSYPIWVDWTPVDRLSPGKYEVLVWLPTQHATAIVSYALLSDGKEVERPTPAEVNQKDHSGVWLSLGTWDLPAEGAVSLRMIVAPGVLGEIGVDAVAISRVE